MSNHGIDVDDKGNVWIGGNGREGTYRPMAADESRNEKGAVHDSFVLKFTQQGKFIAQLGKAGASKGSNDVDDRLAAKTMVDPKTNELYVADGFTGIAASSYSTPIP